jgi:arsenate reductase-like glutaredoxin family protein
MKYHLILIYILLFNSIISCNGINKSTSDIENSNTEILNQNNIDSTSLQLDDEVVSDDQEIKTINWGDGGSYDYYYTEIINIEDTNGEITPIKVYINNVPVNPDCETKKCKWCNSTINLLNSYTEEYPNLDNLRENPNRDSLAQFMLSLGLNASSYISANNSKGVAIRTITSQICEYEDVNGYCSQKCYHEANN